MGRADKSRFKRYTMKKPDYWTKSELTLKTGPVELARAVIQQWINDGRPKADEAAIKYWQGVIRECESRKQN